MYYIFSDFPICLFQRVDILIGGRTIIVEQQKALNREKCQFGVEELKFYGCQFTKDGLKPLLKKVRAVKEFKPHESKEPLRSILGMI